MSSFADRLDWNLLHTFMIVVQERSMTRASLRLHKTQSAISQAIARLEDSVGVKLLHRSRTGLSPTPAGKRLLDQAQLVFTTISRMPIALEETSEAVSGKIKIVMIDSIVCPDFDASLTNFFSIYPEVELEISIDTTSSVINAVELGACTCGISDGVIPEKFKSKEILRESFALFCCGAHRLAGMRDISDSDLRDEPFVGFTADVLGGAHMGDVTAFRAKASIGQHVRGLSSYVSEVRRMIECGLGIGFLPLHLAESHLSDGKLWRLPMLDEVPQAPVYLFSNPSVTLSQAEQLFLQKIS